MTASENKVKNLPHKPGVYLFKDLKGEVLYVGKAKNLKARVKSYFQNGRDLEARLVVMKQNIADFEYIIVSSEIESLILENNLIKQYQPRFNVLLRDDKNYQFIKLDYESEIPQIYTVRKIDHQRRGQMAKYFGPYTSGLSVKQTLHLLKNIFRLCRNKKITAKPCFAYHLGHCPGVCFGKISPAEYRETLNKVEDFLRHRQAPLLSSIKKAMSEAATRKHFERAAYLRDQLRALEHLWQRQKIVSFRAENQDYLGLYRLDHQATICLFLVREGKLIHTEYFELRHPQSAVREILERFILQYYDDASDIPREIVVGQRLEARGLEQALSRLAGRRMKITVPTRGKKLGLLRLAAENAQHYHERQIPEFQKQTSDEILANLAKFLHLPKAPSRIEGYDISNIQGTNPVGSMVVFTGGEADKSQYRKFKINVKDTPDDFAMMREMLTRRFAHLPSAERGGWPVPDLIVVDGGKGQLNVAVKVLKYYGLSLPVIGLAKRLEEIFLPGQKISRVLPANSPMLFLLQRIRDEAHRFAITFYRSRHRQTQTLSRIEDISGVGPVSRRKLIRRFGSAQAVRGASITAIAEVVGLALAKQIKEQLG